VLTWYSIKLRRLSSTHKSTPLTPGHSRSGSLTGASFCQLRYGCGSISQRGRGLSSFLLLHATNVSARHANAARHPHETPSFVPGSSQCHVYSKCRSWITYRGSLSFGEDTRDPSIYHLVGKHVRRWECKSENTVARTLIDFAT